MMRQPIHLVVFLAGLAVLCWIGAGYAGSNPLALGVTLLIGGFYVAGALELLRYRQATGSLRQAIGGMADAPSDLRLWLSQLHPTLRDAVRLRIEGERVALPGPALTPYLVGLLVLLGMLGTFLGMIATLRGTGLALEGATDLQAIRASLAAPVKGLGFAFGTSVAGVATSAMLGLLSALVRRERMQAAQALDSSIATTLRPYSRSHRRDEAFRLLQRQAEVMPALIERLDAMMARFEQQGRALHDQLTTSQAAFHRSTEGAYMELAQTVAQALKEGVEQGAAAAQAAVQPAVETTMAALAREARTLREAVGDTVQQQLDGVSSRFASATEQIAELWEQALERQQQSHAAISGDLRLTLDGFAATFDQRSAMLVDSLGNRVDLAAERAGQAWDDALARQEQAGERLIQAGQQLLAAAGAAFEQNTAALVRAVDQSHEQLQQRLAAGDAERQAAWRQTLADMADALRQEWQQASALAATRQQEISETLARTTLEISSTTQAHAVRTIAEIDRLVEAAGQAPKATAALHEEFAARDAQRLQTWTASLQDMAATLRHEWAQAGEQAANRQQQICDTLARMADEIASQTRAHAADTLAGIEQLVQAAAEAPRAAAALHGELAERDAQRLAAWTGALESMAASLRQEWQQTSELAMRRQQQISEELASMAGAIAQQTRAQAEGTIAEVTRLLEAAAEAPKAAAAVITELRQKLSEGMARDNAMLEERNRLLQTLSTLLDAVNDASSEQRTAVDQLVGSTADLLDRLGARFIDKVESGAATMDSAAAQIASSAVEVASLGEAFGAAVQRFSETNDALATRLQQIEAALDKSLARSDEQLGYYVAQARELVDLSMLSQKQILEELQQLGGARSRSAEAA